MKPSAVASSPESWTKSGPMACRCRLTRAMFAVASFTPTMFFNSKRRAMVSTDMSMTERPVHERAEGLLVHLPVLERGHESGDRASQGLHRGHSSQCGVASVLVRRHISAAAHRRKQGFRRLPPGMVRGSFTVTVPIWDA